MKSESRDRRRASRSPGSGSLPNGGPRAGERAKRGEPERKEAPRPDQQPPEKRDREHLDELLDQELEDSFPASDPPSMTQEPREK